MLHPVNKYLVVAPILEQKQESGVLVPDEYRVDDSAFSLVELLTATSGSTLTPGMKLIVPTHMIEELALFGKKHYVVLENHVVGFFDN